MIGNLPQNFGPRFFTEAWPEPHSLSRAGTECLRSRLMNARRSLAHLCEQLLRQLGIALLPRKQLTV